MHNANAFPAASNNDGLPGRNTGADDPMQTLRHLGARAHQLRAATRAADHYNQQDTEEDRITASWLMSSALGMATELASDIDGLARTLREAAAEAALQRGVAGVRVRAHQLHAASRAADRFLEQESAEDRETGSWLITCAHGLAGRLAADLDDSVMPVRRPVVDKTRIEGHDPQLVRAMNAAMPAPGA